MSEIENGGNAFPADASTNLFSRGMSLRDYFAAKAMQTLLGDMDTPTPEVVSKWAYRHADAMLEARKQ